MASVFEKMISDFKKQDEEYFLEACMEFRTREMKQIPLRYRLIAYGFVKNMSLQELNEKLTEAGCERLYARDFLEASLVFAFSRKMPYERWKELWHICRETVRPMAEDDPLAQQQKISVASLRDYVERNSKADKDGLYTRKLTQYLERDIRTLPGDEREFRQFLERNVKSFSTAREKARYYFCKYLYYYIAEKIEGYLSAAAQGQGIEAATSGLLVLKGTAGLSRRKMKDTDIREFLENASISCGNVYDAFNYYYFGYVSSDWMEVLLDYYGGNITRLPEEEKRKLAGAIKAYDPRWKGRTDEEIIERKWAEMQAEEERLDRVYARDGAAKGYQKNRSGEKSIRNYIKGRVDIDRTTLICYLIFFGSSISVEKEQRITISRVDEILTECGFPGLREKEELDSFVIGYMKSAEPVDYLMESVTRYAFRNQNFFLYHMYNESANNEEQFEKLLKSGK